MEAKESITRGTDIPITITEIPANTVIERLDFAQNGKIVITKMGSDFTIDSYGAHAELTQAETLNLDANRIVEIQVSCKINGKARRTLIAKMPANRILYEGVI